MLVIVFLIVCASSPQEENISVVLIAKNEKMSLSWVNAQFYMIILDLHENTHTLYSTSNLWTYLVVSVNLSCQEIGF
jgi:hypothetical protein